MEEFDHVFGLNLDQRAAAGIAGGRHSDDSRARTGRSPLSARRRAAVEARRVGCDGEGHKGTEWYLTEAE